jgi:hypothetical protein
MITGLAGCETEPKLRLAETRVVPERSKLKHSARCRVSSFQAQSKKTW